MKRLLIVLLCIGFLAAPPARADVVLLDSVTADGSSEEKPIGPATSVIVSIQSAAGSVAVVTIEQKLPSADDWFVVATINNPSASGEVWRGVGGGRLRVTVSGYASGTLTVVLEAWVEMNQLY